MKVWKHFKTITHHRLLVCIGCFKVGLFWQGFMHDMSKYSPTEFKVGLKYYQGTRSPNNAEREAIGYSSAWLHHKGRNKHHSEYWIDLNLKTGEHESVEMPDKYIVEMFCDRIAASKNYNLDNYNPNMPLEYFYRTKDRTPMHKNTQDKLENLLKLYAQHGEKVMFKFLKNKLKSKQKITIDDTISI